MSKRYRSKASEDEEKENRLKKRLERLEDAILRRGKEKHQKKKHRRRHESTSSQNSEVTKDRQDVTVTTNSQQRIIEDTELAMPSSAIGAINLVIDNDPLSAVAERKVRMVFCKRMSKQLLRISKL